MKRDEIKRLQARYGGWALIIIFCAIPVIRWFTLDSFDSHFSTQYGLFSTIGKVGGIVGFVLYAMNFVLSTRLRWLEDWFGGLNRVYVAHHIVGGFALIAILFHPLFLALRMIQPWSVEAFSAASKLFLPRAVDLEASGMAIRTSLAYNDGLIAFTGLVTLLVITFFVKLPYRLWLLTHRFLGVAFLFAGMHILMMPTDLARDSFFKGYMIFWLAAGLAGYTYRVLLGNVAVRRTPYVVQSVRKPNKTGEVVEVTLKPEQKPISYAPGQFMFIKFLNTKGQGIAEESHPFSITSPENSDKVELNIKMVGDFTKSLIKLKPGTKALIEGAFGHFSYRRFGDTPQIWVAGGIGVTPFLGMARSYTADSPAVDFIYSVVKRNELIDEKTLQATLPKKHRQFRFKAYVTEEEKNLLTAEAIERFAKGVKGKEIFLCGPPPMMKSLRAQLRAMGVPNHKIHSEEFSLS